MEAGGRFDARDTLLTRDPWRAPRPNKTGKEGYGKDAKQGEPDDVGHHRPKAKPGQAKKDAEHRSGHHQTWPKTLDERENIARRVARVMRLESGDRGSVSGTESGS